MKTSMYFRCLLIAFISCATLGCYHINTGAPLTESSAFPKAIDKARKAERYFVMHSGHDVYKVTSVLVEKSKKHFTVHLAKVDSVPPVNVTDLDPRNKLNNPAKPQIHLYLKDTTSYTLDEPHTIPLTNIQRIEWVD